MDRTREGKRFAWEVVGAVFFAEALLNFRIQWQHGLAWLNPLLLGMGFLMRGAAVGRMSGIRKFGTIAIAISMTLLGFRLTRL